MAGTGTFGYSGDGGAATSAQISFPQGIAFDAAGNLFIADHGNNRIREVDRATGVISTVAGTGTAGYSGDSALATAAELNAPAGIAFDSAGNLFIADANNYRIREVDHDTGIITTVAGVGTSGFSGDGGAATSAKLGLPMAIGLDSMGDLFIADNGARIREVSHATGIISTVAGTSTGFSGDGGAASLAKLNGAMGVSLDAAGNLYIADSTNGRVREVTSGVTVTITPATLTVTADNLTKAYGSAVPTLTCSYSGFLNGDSAASLAAQPALSTTATAASSVAGGPYAIIVSGAADPNYTIIYVNGWLTVTPAALTVTADNLTKAYAAAMPTLTCSYSGFLSGDSAASLTTQPALSTTATAASSVAGGPYAITVSGAADPNYTMTYVNGWLTVTPAHVVAANDIFVVGAGMITVSASNGVLGNDSPAGFLTVAAGSVAGVAGGVFTFDADGSFTYSPPAAFAGFDHAQYVASDGQGDTAVGTVTVLSRAGAVAWKFYESVLGRAPDDAGLKTWIDHLSQGGSPADMAIAFSESDELLDQIIGGYYQQYLGRAADAEGLAAWKAVWRAAGGPEIVESSIASSPEFYNNAGGAVQGWLTALYQRVLERTPDAQGFSYWEQQLAAGRSKADVVAAFFESPEAFGQDVRTWFEQDFGVQPAAVQLNFYVNQMLAGASDAVIEQELAGAPAYYGNVPSAPSGAALSLPDYLR